MIPCHNRRCLVCHPRLIVTMPAEVAEALLIGVPMVFTISQDAPYVIRPSDWTVERIADLPVPAPADRC